MAEKSCAAEHLYDDSLALLRQSAEAAGLLETEQATLAQAAGRVLAADVASRERIPYYSNSAVDGFALRSHELTRLLDRGRPAQLPVAGRLVAGDQPPAGGSPAECAWEIMTGAPFPEGFDCAAKIEDVQVFRDAEGRAERIAVSEALAAGEALRPAGEDFSPGMRALEAGTLLGPQHIMAAAALGQTELRVRRAPRVAVISTGGEVVDHDKPARPGQVRNSTLPFLETALRREGCSLVSQAAVGDDSRALWAALGKALEAAPDVIITTGGVSMGVHDHVGSVAADLGARRAFHRVAIRPGKPIYFGVFDGKGPALFGLPGNPLSTVVGLRFFVDPYLRARLGRAAEQPLKARLVAGCRKPEGLRCFFKARWELKGAESRVRVLRGQPSFMISPLLEANAWAVLPEAGAALGEGELVDVYPLFGEAP